MRRVAGFFVARPWAFLSSHAEVLLAVAENPESRVAELAEAARITVRHTYRVLRDLERGGCVRRMRRGRCNHYELHREARAPDLPVEEEQSLEALLELLRQARLRSRPGRRARAARASRNPPGAAALSPIRRAHT
jgi:DNA-binding MarR family transcriptional regulator